MVTQVITVIGVIHQEVQGAILPSRAAGTWEGPLSSGGEEDMVTTITTITMLEDLGVITCNKEAHKGVVHLITCRDPLEICKVQTTCKGHLEICKGLQITCMEEGHQITCKDPLEICKVGAHMEICRAEVTPIIITTNSSRSGISSNSGAIMDSRETYCVCVVEWAWGRVKRALRESPFFNQLT